VTDWTIVALIAIGSIFSLLSAIGIVRMPDLYTRMQAATKSATLGVSCLVIAAAIHFGNTSVTTRALLVIAFLFLTAPVAAHVVGRAAYLSGVKLWEHSVLDELQAASGEAAPPPETPAKQAHDGQ
jgi:multicomponent Na+:H+ antiporter subunit G